MDSFVRNLVTEWRRLGLPFGSETVVVAVSGGADSVSLLLAVNDLVRRKKLEHRVVAAHFNHRLRGDESDADEDFVRKLTVKLGIEFAVGKGNVSTEGNVEQNARNARYEFLSKTAINVDAFALVTGHTINDQAETFLMNLIRGSGVEGLSGMLAVRRFEFHGPSSKSDENKPKLPGTQNPELLLVRPLLTWAERIDTERFCNDCDVEYRYDTMNEDTAFKRVRIRKILLPLLVDFNPKIIETLAQTASLLRESQGLGKTGRPGKESNKRSRDKELAALFSQKYLVLAKIRSLPKDELYRVIRSWLKARRGNTRRLELKHIEAIERLILSRKSGRVAELPGGNVTKTGGKLVYDDNKVEN